MVFKKRYWLFYILTMLAGARRQIFVAFAVFLLVKKFSYSIQEITILFVINNLINTVVSPMIGKAVAKYGERRMLSLEYFALIFVFLGYGFTESNGLFHGKGLRLFHKDGDTLLRGDQFRITVECGWNTDIYAVQDFFIEHFSVVRIDRFYSVAAGLLCRGFPVAVTECRDLYLVFLHERLKTG